jgi:hypothetical protein
VNGAPALIDLFPLLLSLLSVNLDLLGKIIGIAESYLLLGSPVLLQALSQIFSPKFHADETFIQNFAVDIFRAVLEPLAGSHTASVNVKDLVVALHLLVQIAPASQWGEAMHNSGLFGHIINRVLEPKVCD